MFCSVHIHRPETLDVPLKHILLAHHRRVISDDEEAYSRMYVIHKNLWENALAGFKRPSFDVSKQIKVIFIGEPCEDAGGPMREFFTLLMQEVALKSGLLEG